MFILYMILLYLAIGYIVSIAYSVIVKLKFGKKAFVTGEWCPEFLAVPGWPLFVIFGFFYGLTILLTSVITVISDKIVDIL